MRRDSSHHLGAIWEKAETLAGTDTEVQQQMKTAKDGPEHGSMYERVEADREGLTKVLAGRASCEEDREDKGAVKLWEMLCKQAEAMGGGRGGSLGGRRQTERGERWEVDETKVDAYGPGAKKRCTEVWDGGKEIGWRDADEEWWENVSMATANVTWQEDTRLLVAEGEEGGAITCDAVVEDVILRMCVRSKMVEGEGVEMMDGRRLTMEKGKMEMEKQTGAETAYAKHTKRVLELTLVGVEKEGVTQAYATDASAGEEGVGVGIWKGVGETGTEEERVRWGVRGCTCPPGWDNDDGELFGILWAVSMGYEEGKQKHGEDSKEVVMVLTDSWSMVQAVEGSWKMGGAAEGAARARAMMIEAICWYRKRMRVIMVYVPSHVGVVMNTWADAIADIYARGDPNMGWIWEMVTGKTSRAVAYKGKDGGVLNGKAYNIMKAGARKWTVDRMKEKLKGMPEVQGRWARLAKEGAGRDYRSVGEKEAGGWGAATNHRTSVAMAVRWGDHKDVPQGRAWRGRLESERRRNAPGEARWIGMCGCPCGRGKETHGRGGEGKWERQDRRRDNRRAGGRRVETWGPVEREARTWGNRYAVLSETTADVRHVHSGECSMVKQRQERVQGLKRAVEEVERVVKELGGEECEEEETGDGRIEYDEDRWHFTVKGDCWAEKEEGEIRVWIEIREVGEARMVKKGEMLLCREGNTKEEMTESLMETKEGRWPIGRVERTLVCREADTRMAASGRAAHVRGRKTLPLHRYRVKGPRAMRREARVAAARAACAVHELWTDREGDKEVREGWPKEWMQEVEKATDAIDRIRRGRKARGEEYEGLRKIMGAEMAEPKGVKKEGRRTLVAAVAAVQLAASSIRTGWVTGTRGQRERDEGVREGQEKLRVIMRMWLATVQGRKRANPWTECECRLKEGWKWGSTCECRHVSTTDVPWEWRWWRAWLWVCGKVKGQKRVTESWRRSAADNWRGRREQGKKKETGEETIVGRWTGGKWTQMRMEWRGGEGKVTQRLGDGDRAGRDENWRHMENEGRREEAVRGTTPKAARTTEETTKGGVGGGRRKWRGGEYLRYCREMKIGVWEGAWRRAGEEILPRRGVG